MQPLFDLGHEPDSDDDRDDVALIAHQRDGIQPAEHRLVGLHALGRNSPGVLQVGWIMIMPMTTPRNGLLPKTFAAEKAMRMGTCWRTAGPAAGGRPCPLPCGNAGGHWSAARRPPGPHGCRRRRPPSHPRARRPWLRQYWMAPMAMVSVAQNSALISPTSFAEAPSQRGSFLQHKKPHPCGCGLRIYFILLWQLHGGGGQCPPAPSG